MERGSASMPHRGAQDFSVRQEDGLVSDGRPCYDIDEADTLKTLAHLKRRLRTLPADDFWTALTEGISHMLSADASFVFKCDQNDGHCASVGTLSEERPLCFKTSAGTPFYHCTNASSPARNCPCERLRDPKEGAVYEAFSVDGMENWALPSKAYIAVPLMGEDRCVGHLGCKWSTEGSWRRHSWGFTELILRSLEDQIIGRISPLAECKDPSPGPQTACASPFMAPAQSLRTYAGSLSHELRTPMQGIVGILDVMYATIEDNVKTGTDEKDRTVFEKLMGYIENVQDSSRRAVEAADNVVHAYDMDMSVPEAAANLSFDDTVTPVAVHVECKRPEISVVVGDERRSASAHKRRRENEAPSAAAFRRSRKLMRKAGSSMASNQENLPSHETKEGLVEAKLVESHARPGATPADAPTVQDAHLAANSIHPTGYPMAHGLRFVQINEVFRYVINEGLKLGGRPETMAAQDTPNGQIIRVKSRGSDGIVLNKMIEWRIDENVPIGLFIDEKDLSKLISCVFLNANKFTNHEGGRVAVYAKMCSKGRHISIRVSDNGPGIPAAFLPRLYQPFSRENYSTTRQSEGLGLGLMVAKGIARKLGGDLMCTRAETSAPHNGSEFEIKLPVTVGDTVSRAASPFTSPMLHNAKLVTPSSSPSLTTNGSPRPLSSALITTVTPHPPLRPLPANTPSPTDDLPRPTFPPTTTTTTTIALTKTTDPTPNPHHPLTIPQSPPTPPETSPTSTASPPSLLPPSSRYTPTVNRSLAASHPLTFLIAEDNPINRRLMATMLCTLGYTPAQILTAADGAEAVRLVSQSLHAHSQGKGKAPAPDREVDDTSKPAASHPPKIDIVLMDLWMPVMDGYEAAARIGHMGPGAPRVVAVSADITTDAQARMRGKGFQGSVSKPLRLLDLQGLVVDMVSGAGRGFGQEV